jgi:hypothetical protein
MNGFGSYSCGEDDTMLPYPPPLTRPNANTAQNSLLRALGGVLAAFSILLAVLGIILHQRILDLIFAIIVGLIALRILALWLGFKPQHQQQPTAGWTPMGQGSYPLHATGSPPGQYAPYAPAYPQSQPHYQLAAEQNIHQPVPIPPAPAATAPTPPKLPRSIRPQRPAQTQAPAFPVQPAPPDPGTQPIPPLAPSSPWQSQYPPVTMPSSDPPPLQERSWLYDDGDSITQQ